MKKRDIFKQYELFQTDLHWDCFWSLLFSITILTERLQVFKSLRLYYHIIKDSMPNCYFKFSYKVVPRLL